MSLRLRENGLPHDTYDRGHARSSSRAAAGLINPVTGRRFVLVEGYRDYLNHFAVYAEASTLLGQTWLYELVIYRDLSSPKDRNQWDARRLEDPYRNYLGAPVAAGMAGLSPKLSATWLGPTTGAYRVDVSGLIAAYRVLLKSERTLREQDLDDDGIRPEGARWKVAGKPYDMVIDCRGASSAQGAYWRELPWRLSKGEALRLSNLAWPRESAAKVGGLFASPTGDGSDLWYGGTSTDHYEYELPDPATSARLAAEADGLGLLESGMPHEYLAAVRPTMRDRITRAIRHPELPGLYLCNGFGTKGALVGPSVVAELWSILRADLGV